MWNINWGNDHKETKTKYSETTTEDSTITRGDWDTTFAVEESYGKLKSFNLQDLQMTSFADAEKYTKNAVSQIFRQYQETALPSIYGGQNQAGVFGSSTSQLMGNDAYSRAVNQSAELQLGLANTFIAQGLQNFDQMGTLFSTLLSANQNQTTVTDSTITKKGNSKVFEWGGHVEAGFGGVGGGQTEAQRNAGSSKTLTSGGGGKS